MNRARRGVTLIETLIALAVVALAGVVVLRLQRETSQSLLRSMADDAEMRRASALLDAVTLWSPEDLDRHLGTREQGPWRMHVDRDDRFLYHISLRDSTDRHVLLQTTLYRRELPRLVEGSSQRNGLLQ